MCLFVLLFVICTLRCAPFRPPGPRNGAFFSCVTFPPESNIRAAFVLLRRLFQGNKNIPPRPSFKVRGLFFRFITVKYFTLSFLCVSLQRNSQSINQSMNTMDGLIQELLEYLKNTPEAQKQKDWEALSGYGRLGPSVSDYLTYLLGGVPQMEIKNNSKIPEYSLEFFF